MQLTKDVLEQDRKAYVRQIQSLQAVINYIDGQLAYLDKTEPAPESATEEKGPDDAPTS